MYLYILKCTNRAMNLFRRGATLFASGSPARIHIRIPCTRERLAMAMLFILQIYS